MFDAKYYNSLDLDISNEEVLKEINSIKSYNKNPYYSGNRWNKTILKYQWKEFYKNEIELWKKPEIRRKLFKNRFQYIKKSFGQISRKELLSGFKISGIYVGYSFHSPLWIKGFIEEYNINSIYDPCGGWGHRLLGSYCSGINYIYNDINSEVVENIIKMNKDLNYNCKIYNNDASLFTPEDDYECVFTCPPYWKKEIYTSKGAENLSYNDFLVWWDKLINSSLKSSVKYFAYIISNDLMNDMNKVCMKNGLELVEIKQLNNDSNYNHFERKQGSNKSEALVIFKKTS